MAEINWHNLAFRQVVKTLGTDIDKGLTEKEVEELQRKHGKNELPEEKPASRIKIFLSQLRSPLIYILIAAGIITLFFKEWADTVVIFAAVGLNTIVGYVQESKASNALRELKKVLRVKAAVFRDGKEKEIFQEELVPGDIVVLKSGNKVPADGRIVESWNLKVNEAPLTGEWLAADKSINILPQETPLADRDNMVYMGTTIEDGEGKAVVTEVGGKSELGKVAGLIRETKEQKTPYQKKLSHFSKIVALAIAVICLGIFIEGMLRFSDISLVERFKEIFTTTVAVAVAAIPEGLPIAMTVILALGMERILRRRGLVRKLASAETLGSTSIIATDKTLTLTEGRMEVIEVKSDNQNLALQIGALANEAFVENPRDGFKKWKIRGRPTDRALVIAAAKQGLKKPQLEKQLPKIDEIPFNTQDKFIAALHRSGNWNLLYVSGAPEKVINLCSKVQRKKSTRIITSRTASGLQQQLEELTGRGLRVVAVAFRKFKPENIKVNKKKSSIAQAKDRTKPDSSYLKKEVKEMTFVGFIGLRDPLRKETKKAFSICKKAGMKPIIVTGDHMLTAKAVARELGLKVKKENIMLGEELDNLSDEKLQKVLNKINVFARVEPRHKLRIITAWQAQDQVVAMTGDGINDAPALKKADIGVALGSGTDVAKEVSDLVLLNDNFSVIVAAVEEGRAILDNIRKVITYLLSSSFTEVILIGTSILAKFPLPVTAVQILWVNLIEDGLPNIALAFEPKEKDLMKHKPQSQKVPLLTREMKTIIFIIGILSDLLLLGLFFLLFKKFGKENIGYIRTMIFSALSIDSLFYVFSCKSLRRSIWQINVFSNKLLVVAWIVGFIALFATVYFPPLQTVLKTVPLGVLDWLILMGLGIIEVSAIEAAKHYFIARHQTNV